jgi:OmpA-OmpF porin, OOP family
MRQRTLLLLVGALAVLAARPARAQAGFAVNRFDPSEPGSDWFVNDSLDLRGSPNVAAGMTWDWSYRPLVLREAQDGAEVLRTVVTDQIVAHAAVAFMLHDRFRAALDFPVVVFQRGDDVSQTVPQLEPLHSSAVGDLRLSGDVRVTGQYGDPFTLALGAQVHVPTGRRSQLSSDGTFRFVPRVLVAGDVASLVYAGKLGFAYRPHDATFAGRQLTSEAIFSVAGGVRVNDIFVFGPELSGATALGKGVEPFEQRSTPLELLLGLHVTLAEHWQLGSGIGPGFTRADGTPSMRLVLSLAFAPDVCVDPDGDGICAPSDACPDVDGVRTGRRSTNGCPGDRDRDGVFDTHDACVDRPGPASAEPTTNGCPPGTEATQPEPVPPK